MPRPTRASGPLLSGPEFGRLLALSVMLILVIGGIVRLRQPGALDSFLPNSPAPTPAPVLTQTDECREVNRAYLAKVKDKTPQDPADRDAIFQLLCLATTRPESAQASSARRDVLFANLYQEPANYRGELIRVKGVLARLLAWDSPPDRNPHGFPRYYEAWIFSEDQSTNPMVVLFSEAPVGLTPSDNLKENVSIDAFFVKLLAYETREGKTRGAPMLVGGKLHWDRPTGDFWSQAMLLAVAVAALVLVGGLVFWRQNRRDEALLRGFRDVVPRPTDIDPFASDSADRDAPGPPMISSPPPLQEPGP